MASAPVRKFEQGEVICRQGEAATSVFLLNEGAVSLSVQSEEFAEISRGRPGDGVELEILTGEGTLLGCEGVLLGRRLHTLTAAEPTAAVELPLDREAATALIASDRGFGLSLARVLARRLVAANRRLNAGQRLAGRFMRDLQGACTDFFNLVSKVRKEIEEGLQGELATVLRCWTYHMGEAGGAEVAEETSNAMELLGGGLEGIGSSMKLSAGDILCKKGDPGDSVFILISGRLSVRIGEEVFGIVRAGETVGEISVLLQDDDPRRVADVYADEASAVAMIPAANFRSLVDTEPSLLINTCKLLALRTSSMEQLGATGEGAVEAVASKYHSAGDTFIKDIELLERKLDLLIETHGKPFHLEFSRLGHIAEGWRKKAGELNERLRTAAR